jgi:hypothetical protein
METVSTEKRSVFARPGLLLRLEGLMVGLSAVIAFYHLRGPGWLLAVVALAPDLAMVGYLRGAAFGAPLYNLVHTYALPVALFGLSAATSWLFGGWVALVWLAHIGFDRLLGFGLKYPTTFKDTHMQRV